MKITKDMEGKLVCVKRKPPIMVVAVGSEMFLGISTAWSDGDVEEMPYTTDGEWELVEKDKKPSEIIIENAAKKDHSIFPTFPSSVIGSILDYLDEQADVPKR